MNKSESFWGAIQPKKSKREMAQALEMCNDSISDSPLMIYMTFVAAVCESCLEKRLEEERRSQLVYSRAAIYVRQVDKIGALTDNLTDAPSATAFSSSVAEDPDFQVIPFSPTLA